MAGDGSTARVALGEDVASEGGGAPAPYNLVVKKLQAEKGRSWGVPHSGMRSSTESISDWLTGRRLSRLHPVSAFREWGQQLLVVLVPF